MDLLLARVDELNRFIRENNLVAPPASAETVSVLSKLGHNLDQDGLNNAMPEPTNSAVDSDAGVCHENECSFVQKLDWDWSEDVLGCDFDVSNFWDFELSQGLLPNADGTQTMFDAPVLSAPGQSSTSDSSDDEDVEALIDQVSYRVGSLKIEAGGQTRYYGPTSNYSMEEVSAPEGQVIINRTVRKDGQAALKSLGLDREVPPEMEKHLIELYFCWQEPFINGIDRSLYESAQTAWEEKEEDTPYYSESLKYAMFVTQRG
jgi:hypothetical protein